MDVPATRAGGPFVVQHRSGVRVEGLDLDALVAQGMRRAVVACIVTDGH
ncbi:MAG TPA: hypothetical protein VM694_22135 [Polyangium sp.]|jgi:hypothetical protein|nr:hypothetical protein [Polyangium sp.]